MIDDDDNNSPTATILTRSYCLMFCCHPQGTATICWSAGGIGPHTAYLQQSSQSVSFKLHLAIHIIYYWKAMFQIIVLDSAIIVLGPWQSM